MRKLKIAIIGCKNMGSKHLKILREFFADEVEIAGILSSTPQSSAAKAAELGVPYFSHLEEITPHNTDAAIIATPATSHCAVGTVLLRKGIPCLIEKPLAATDHECEHLEAAACEGNATILVGHLTNYDPAVISLHRHLKAPVKSIKAIRTSANVGVKDISVISELMIHDLAIVNSLIHSSLRKSCISKPDSYRWDENAVVIMEFDDGSVVELEGLIDSVPVTRTMDIEDTNGNLYHLNFVKHSLACNGEILCEGGNPLKKELANFISMARGESKPLVTAEEGRKNLEICTFLENKISF